MQNKKCFNQGDPFCRYNWHGFHGFHWQHHCEVEYLTGHDNNHCNWSGKKKIGNEVCLPPPSASLLKQRCLNNLLIFVRTQHTRNIKERREQNLLQCLCPGAMKSPRCNAINPVNTEARTEGPFRDSQRLVQEIPVQREENVRKTKAGRIMVPTCTPRAHVTSWSCAASCFWNSWGRGLP